MPDLWDMLTATNSDPTEKLSELDPLLFGVTIREWARGNVTRAQVIEFLKLDADATANLDAMQAHYATLTVAERTEYRAELQDVAILVAQRPDIFTKAVAAARLGI